MSNTNKTFSKLYSEDKRQVFRLNIEWDEDSFKLYILDNKTAWCALVTNQHLTKLAEQHDLTFAEYMERLREYICNAPSSVTCGITVNNNTFVIYHHIEQEEFKIKYFVIKLKKLDYQEYVEGLIDTLTSKCQEMSNMLILLEEQKIKVEKEKTLLEHKHEQLVEMKNKSDQQIYGAVALILNEKKNRIQFLTELLEEYQNGNMAHIKSAKNIKSLQNNTKTELNIPIPSTSKQEVMSDSESNSSDGYNTDDDKTLNIKKRANDDLDFLGSDSPRHPVVPKRFKSDKNILLVNDSATTSKETEFALMKPVIESTENNSLDSVEDQSQSQHFDTQDFLDRM